MTRLLAPFLTLLLALGLLGATASAEDGLDDGSGSGPRTWGVSPASAEGPDERSSIQLVTEPGQDYIDHVAVHNLSEDELALSLYAADAVNTTDGGYDLLTDEEDSAFAGAWITLAENGVTLAPRESTVVPFEVSVPAEAEPGDHSAGIVAVLTRTSDQGVSTQHRAGTRIHVRVAGPAEPSAEITVDDARFSASLLPFARGEVAVTYTIANTGNIRLDGVPRISVTGPFGLAGRDVADEEFTDLLPGNSLQRTVLLDGVAPLLRSGVRVEIAEPVSRGQDMSEVLTVEGGESGLWTVSSPTLLVLLLIAGGIAVWLWRRRRAAEDESTRRPEEPGDAVSTGPSDADLV